MKTNTNARMNFSIPLRCGITLMALTLCLGAAYSQTPMFSETRTFKTGPIELFVHDDKCYFAAAGDVESNVELYMSSGIGSKQIRDIRKGGEGSFPSGFTYGPNHGYIYFIADDGIHGEEVWAIDPSIDGAWRFIDFNVIPKIIPPDPIYGTEGSNPRYITPFYEPVSSYSSHFVCAADYATNLDSASQNELIRVTSSPSARMIDIRPGPESSHPRDITAGRRYYPGDYGKGWYTAFFFSADDGTKGRELTRYSYWHDGYMITSVDIRPGPESSFPLNFTSSGNYMYFTADNGTNGRELWIDSGYGGQVRVVKDINPGSPSSGPTKLTSAGNGLIYFTAFTPETGRELWKSNGTEAGTIMVRDIYPGDVSSLPDHLCMVGDTLFFTANDGTNGIELWKSDGTEAGTIRVKDIRIGDAGSNPQHLTALGGKCYFTCDSNGDGQRELWVTDGSPHGSLALVSRFPGKPNLSQLTAGESRLFLTVGNMLFCYNPNGDYPPGAPSEVKGFPGVNHIEFEYKLNSISGASEVLYYSAGTNPPERFYVRQSQSPLGLNYFYDSGLLPNKPYSFSVRSLINHVNYSHWPDSPYITVWTLAPRPEKIGSSTSVNTWTNQSSIEFIYYGSGIVGEGGVSGYRYAFNMNPSYSPTEIDNIWNDPLVNLVINVTVSGYYNLHLQSLNEQDIANPDTVTIGSYWFDFYAPAAPPAPVGVVANSPNIQFDWDEPTDSGGSGVASYECQIGTSAGASNVYSGNVGAARSKTITGAAGNSYYARVRAIDAAGNVGSWSDNSEGVPLTNQVGSLLVTLSPPTAQIFGAWRRVGTDAWLGHNTIENNVPVGVQFVEFREQSNWLRPSNKTVTIVSGEQSSASGTYAQSGSLKVTILPPEAVSAGAMWRWDNGIQKSSWTDSAVSRNTAAGTYAIEFKDVIDWIKPDNIESVTVYQGSLTSLEGAGTTYVGDMGFIMVTIAPSEAVTAGAQWKRAGSDEWKDSGDAENDVPIGNQTITFKDVSGWKKPEDALVNVTKDGVTTLQGGDATYFHHAGTLTVNITPEAILNVGAQWQRAGGAGWKNSGETETNIPVGEYRVTFTPIDGWVSPEDRDVTIVNDEGTILNVIYEEPADLSDRVINHILNRARLESTLFTPADANNNGDIDIGDVIALIRKGL